MKTSTGKDLSPRIAARILICMFGDQYDSMSDEEMLQNIDVPKAPNGQIKKIREFLNKESARVHKFLGNPYQYTEK